MANFLRTNLINKKIYALDSFEGFDLKELKRERKRGLACASDSAFTSTSYEYVTEKIRILGLEDYIIPTKGYFQDTLVKVANKPLSYALIDCDLKNSLIFCAETIWENLAGNGRIVFDDYRHVRFHGAKIGVDYFVEKYEEEIFEHGLLNRLYYVVKK